MTKTQIAAKFGIGLACVALSATFAGSANAQTISNGAGTFTYGVSSDGNGYDFNTGIGFQRAGDGYDPVAPGTPRSYWAVSNGTTTGYADPASFGETVGITGASYTANTADISATAGGAIGVDQKFSFVKANVVSIVTTVTNTTGTASDILFTRGYDADVVPTAFNETTTVSPFADNVVAATFYGFENPDPTVPYSFGSGPGGGTAGPGDLGGGFVLDLGTLGAGQSKTFTILEGINDFGQTPIGLDGELQGLGANFFVTTYSSDGDITNASNSIALGLVGSSVPEPSQAAALSIGVLGLALLGFKARKRQQLGA